MIVRQNGVTIGSKNYSTDGLKLLNEIIQEEDNLVIEVVKNDLSFDQINIRKKGSDNSVTVDKATWDRMCDNMDNLENNILRNHTKDKNENS